MLPSAKLTASAPAIPYFRGSITRPAHSLSTLRRMGRPTATQDSLPDGWPAFPGGIDYPLGPNERFQVLSILLSQASPGAPMFFAKNAEMGRVFRRFPGIKALSPVLPQRCAEREKSLENQPLLASDSFLRVYFDFNLPSTLPTSSRTVRA